MTLAATAIVSGIVLLAFPFFAWVVFVREPALEAEERMKEKAQRDIQKAALKIFADEAKRGRREAV